MLCISKSTPIIIQGVNCRVEQSTRRWGCKKNLHKTLPIVVNVKFYFPWSSDHHHEVRWKWRHKEKRLVDIDDMCQRSWDLSYQKGIHEATRVDCPPVRVQMLKYQAELPLFQVRHSSRVRELLLRGVSIPDLSRDNDASTASATECQQQRCWQLITKCTTVDPSIFTDALSW